MAGLSIAAVLALLVLVGAAATASAYDDSSFDDAYDTYDPAAYEVEDVSNLDVYGEDLDEAAVAAFDEEYEGEEGAAPPAEGVAPPATSGPEGGAPPAAPAPDAAPAAPPAKPKGKGRGKKGGRRGRKRHGKGKKGKRGRGKKGKGMRKKGKAKNKSKKPKAAAAAPPAEAAPADEYEYWAADDDVADAEYDQGRSLGIRSTVRKGRDKYRNWRAKRKAKRAGSSSGGEGPMAEPAPEEDGYDQGRSLGIRSNLRKGRDKYRSWRAKRKAKKAGSSSGGEGAMAEPMPEDDESYESSRVAGLHTSRWRKAKNAVRATRDKVQEKRSAYNKMQQEKKFGKLQKRGDKAKEKYNAMMMQSKANLGLAGSEEDYY